MANNVAIQALFSELTILCKCFGTLVCQILEVLHAPGLLLHGVRHSKPTDVAAASFTHLVGRPPPDYGPYQGPGGGRGGRRY